MLQYPSLPDTQKESLEVTPMSSHIETRTLEAVLVSPLINGQHVLSFVTLTANMTHSIIKIGRDANFVADNLVKKARQIVVPRPCLVPFKVPSFFTLSPSHQFLDAYMEH